VKISIVDYGAGNLPSVERAFLRAGAETERVTSPEQVVAARAIVLPGVGHFAAFVAGLRERNLTRSLRAAIDLGIPVLGICLGLQALFQCSEEAPGETGLNLIHQKIRGLPQEVKSPHIGWNQVRLIRPGILLEGIAENAYFYFAHSYAAAVCDPFTAAVCDHGFPFVAVIEHRHLMAVQFHPEKSGEAGARLLGNFVEWVG
jgi:imidazole glycerol phosphate synthase glutamine amidotransferase subunit